MNDVEQLNKEMDEELEKGPGLRMAFTQIRTLSKELEKAKAMLAEICHNMHRPDYVEQCYIKRFEDGN